MSARAAEAAVETRIWFDAKQVAEYVGVHHQTVLYAVWGGELHGYQRKAPRGRWRFHRDCVDAWMKGERCPHVADPKKQPSTG